MRWVRNLPPLPETAARRLSAMSCALVPLIHSFEDVTGQAQGHLGVLVAGIWGVWITHRLPHFFTAAVRASSALMSSLMSFVALGVRSICAISVSCGCVFKRGQREKCGCVVTAQFAGDVK